MWEGFRILLHSTNRFNCCELQSDGGKCSTLVTVTCTLDSCRPQQKLKELRKTYNEKEGEEEELTDEQLALKGAENEIGDLAMEKTNNSLNSLNSIGSGGKEEARKKEGDDDSSKDSVIEVTSTGSKGDSSSEVESNTEKEKKKELENRMSKKKGENPMLANCKKRTGASSPSPSVG